MDKDVVNNQLDIIEDKIKKYEKFKKCILELDKSNKITKEKYETFCNIFCDIPNSTGIYRKFTVELAKKIFPNADNFTFSNGYIKFDLCSFRCDLSLYTPTVKIELYDYIKRKHDFELLHGTHYDMKKYFEGIDAHENWEVLFNLRFSNYENKPRWYKHLKWIFRKPESSFRDKWEDAFKEDEINFKKEYEKYLQARKVSIEQVDLIKNKLVPELRKFTDDIKISNNRYNLELDELLEEENKNKEIENLEMPEDWDKFMKEHNMSGLIKI